MKKIIRPPENWQDFETLCKKLFGEIWGCSMTIKKNGRLGQPQSGVDIYGKPKGETDYWGIQCKGKDNYIDAQLTEKEIKESAKARKFEPKLKTFIFATTAPKDVHIEKIVRIKDQESCSSGSFQIVLYCWQDIADLIEENRETFNWYVNEIQFKNKYDIEVSYTTKNNNNIFSPKFLKTITDYKLRPEPDKLPYYSFNSLNLINPLLVDIEPISLFGSNKVNHAWCSFTTSIKNCGSMVIEDWKLWLDFSEDVRKIDDDFTKDIFMYKELAKYRTTWAYEDVNQILYEPLDNTPLIQKDTKSFKSYCIPKFDSKEVIVQWHLLARDFDRKGEFVIKVAPEYELKHKTEYVDSIENVKRDEVISDYITTRTE